MASQSLVGRMIPCPHFQIRHRISVCGGSVFSMGYAVWSRCGDVIDSPNGPEWDKFPSSDLKNPDNVRLDRSPGICFRNKLQFPVTTKSMRGRIPRRSSRGFFVVHPPHFSSSRWSPREVAARGQSRGTGAGSGLAASGARPTAATAVLSCHWTRNLPVPLFRKPAVSAHRHRRYLRLPLPLPFVAG